MKFLPGSLFCVAALLALTGCENPVHSVGLNVNPVLGTIGGSVEFKEVIVDGRIVRVAVRNTATRDLCEPAPAVKAVRAIEPCDTTRALGEVVDLGGTRYVVSTHYTVDAGRGLRALTGNIATTRSTARALSRSARDAMEQERDLKRAAKAVANDEISRLRAIERATNPSMLGSLRRAFSFRGTGCGQPATPILVTDGGPIETPPPPFIDQGTPPSQGVPPSGEMKSATNVELRVAAVEAELKGIRDDIKAIRDALRKP